MIEWFNAKGVVDKSERTFGFLLRIFGIDISVMLLGWINDWKLIDIRIPVNYGVYFQSLFLLVSIGRLPTQTYKNVEDYD